MDQRLDWKSHIEEIRRKTSKSITALASLGSSTWGIRMSDVRKIYRGAVVPHMMYACSAWSNSRANGDPYTRKALGVPQSLQARGPRAICGAFRATSQADLDIEAHLLPSIQQIEKHRTHALGRIMSCHAIPELGDVSKGETSGNAHIPSYTSPFSNTDRR